MKPSTSDCIPSDEIEHRIQSIQQKLQTTDMGGLVILQRADLLYFSGTVQNGFLFIPAEGEPLLMIRRYYPRALQDSSLKNIIEIKSVKEVPERIRDYFGTLPQQLGFELDVLPARDFLFYQTLFPESRLVDGSELILETRMIKSDWEIEQMQKVAALSARTFEFMRSVLKPGLNELEFAGLGEGFSRKCGHNGKIRMRDYQAQAYAGHVLSGKHSAELGLLDSPASGSGTSAAFSCGPGWKHLAPNEPIFVDFAFASNGYHMDETRMFAIGTLPQKAMDTIQIAIDIHNALLDHSKPGMTAHEIFEFGLSMAERAGYSRSYLGPEGYQMTFVGHGIGVELVEPPFLAMGKSTVLAPGMTFAIEPKLVVEGEFMVGVESVFQITETGTRLISKVPVEILTV